MRAKSLIIAAATLAVLVVVVVGLTELGGQSSSTAPLKMTVGEMQAQLAGSPAPLAGIHAQAGELLAGGVSSVRARLAALRGEPIVVNKWASWCGPCQAETPIFQRVALSMGRKVAFIGIDSEEHEHADAVDFLRTHPLSYPSYYDPSGEAGQAITESGVIPVTVFYNSSGAKFVRQGQFPSVAKLEEDIRRYALGG